MIIEIDFNSDEALYMQLRNQIILGIATSQYQEGEALPSVRSLADTIGIKKENAATYENSEKGVQANYQAVSQMVHSLAATSSLVGSPWKNSIVPGK